MENLRFSNFAYLRKMSLLDNGVTLCVHIQLCANCNFHIASSINALTSPTSSCLKLILSTDSMRKGLGKWLLYRNAFHDNQII